MKKILIIGAGVIGLSIAYELSKIKKFKIIVLEKSKTVGSGNTFKNSEVIHSGVYYKKNSLKNTLCIEGKKLIYQFCRKFKIKYLKTGKLFLACSKKEVNYLNILKKNAIKNGVNDVKIINKDQLKSIGPFLNGNKALLSPSAGIFDVKAFIKKLFKISKKNDVIFKFNTKKLVIKKKNKKFYSNYTKNYLFDYVINCAGMEAIKIAEKSFPGHKFPHNNFVKGIYFMTKQNLKLKKIVYRAMLPGDIKERIDITPLLSGGYIFGPSVEKSKLINKKKLKYKFIDGIKNYLPEINEKKILYLKEGVRPKIMFNKIKSNEDFYIKKIKDCNWINLFGIESPGLTSALSIAKYVKRIM
jgi:L-2-hydroxyglutarate oxidase LhgO